MPLVDVMLVLLIIFMVTAPMIQRGIDVKLPRRDARRSRFRASGIFVTVPADFRQRHDRVPRRRADARRRPAGAGPAEDGDGDRKKVFLRGDGDVQYQDLMDVFDR